MIASVPRRRRSPLHDGSLFQPRRPAFWVYVVIVIATGIFSIGEQSLFRQISPAGWALSWALLALYALPVLFLVYVLDLYEREPLSLVLGALLWGAVAATTLSGFANDGWGLVVARVGGPEFAARWTAALTAPFVEEILKGLGVVLIYLIAPDEFDDMMDGFVYGAVCGLGFAVVEDVFYFMGVFGGHPNGVLQGFFVRVVASGLYSHVLYTGLVGMGIGYLVSRRERQPLKRRIAVLAGLSAAAVLGHFLWNSPLLDLFPAQPWSGADLLMIPVATAVKGLPLLAFGTLAVVLARRRERKWLHGALAEEIGGSGISAIELATLEHPRRRRAAVGDMRTRAGAHAAALLRRLQKEQVNLAMIRSKVASGDDPALIEQRAYCGSLRDALRAIPGAAPADAAGSLTDVGPRDR
jgi:Predicted membrane protein